MDIDLGKVRRSGPLEDMKTRKAFLESEDHQIRFVDTPRHCSWLHQVEIWLSILARRPLRCGSVASTKDLRERVLSLISYFNTSSSNLLGRPMQGAHYKRPHDRIGI